MTYNIVSSHPMHPTIERNVLPTPRLLSEGTRRSVEAYRSSEYNGRGVWRVRDDSFDPAGTQYRLVQVEVLED